MKIITFALHAFCALLLAGCGGTAKLPPTYTLVKNKGVLYSRFSEQNPGVYSTLSFKNLDSNKTELHVIDRRTMGSRDNFIVREFPPGNWRFTYFYLESFNGSQKTTYAIKDSLSIDFTITAGETNYLPDLDAQTDCAFKSVGLSGKALGKCEAFTLTLRENKAQADSELVARYKNLRPAGAAHCLKSPEAVGQAIKGEFVDPSIAFLANPAGSNTDEYGRPKQQVNPVTGKWETKY